MYMIQITNEKKAEMSEMCEKVLRYAGKLMSCIEEFESEGMDGEHFGYGERMDGGRYGMGRRAGEWEPRVPYGRRDHDMEMIGERSYRKNY